MSKYTWAWSDEDATYILEADSLFEIVETIVDYYFGWGDDDDETPYTIAELKTFVTSTITRERTYKSLIKEVKLL